MLSAAAVCNRCALLCCSPTTLRTRVYHVDVHSKTVARFVQFRHRLLLGRRTRDKLCATPAQTDINDKMRAILIDWLVEVHLKFKVCQVLCRPKMCSSSMSESVYFLLARCYDDMALL